MEVITMRGISAFTFCICFVSVFASSNLLSAGDGDCCCPVCANKSGVVKTIERCKECCTPKVALPPRGVMSFTVTAIPTNKLAAPIDFRKVNETQQKSSMSEEDFDKLIELLTAETTKRKAATEPKSQKSSAEMKSASEADVETQIKNLEANLQELQSQVKQLNEATSTISELLRMKAESLKKE